MIYFIHDSIFPLFVFHPQFHPGSAVKSNPPPFLIQNPLFVHGVTATHSPQNKTQLYRSNFTSSKLAHPVFFSLVNPLHSAFAPPPLSYRPSGTRIVHDACPEIRGGACKLAPIYYLRTTGKTHTNMLFSVLI